MLMVMVTDLSGPGSGPCSGFLSGSLGPRRRKPLAAMASRSDSTKGRASIAERPGKHRGDELEHLVARIVPIGVVESFEVVHVAHCDGIAAAQLRHELFEGSPPGQSCQFIAVGHLIAVLKRLVEQDQARSAEVKQCLLILSCLPQPHKCGYQRQEQSRLNSRAPEHRQAQQRERCGCERKLLAKWNPARAGSVLAPVQESLQWAPAYLPQHNHAGTLDRDQSYL